MEVDSGDYHVLSNAVKDVKGISGIIIELGQRKGGSMEVILNAIRDTEQKRIVVACDPYGMIPYETGWGGKTRLDYTNTMRDICLRDIYSLVTVREHVNYLFFCMEDIEFFGRFADGVPVYDYTKRIINEYALAFLDAGHVLNEIYAQIGFFAPRMEVGAIMVVDDIDFIDYEALKTEFFLYDFHEFEVSNKKASFKKGFKK